MKLNIHALVVMLLKGKVVVGITVRKSVDFSFFLFVSPVLLSIQRAKGASESHRASQWKKGIVEGETGLMWHSFEILGDDF